MPFYQLYYHLVWCTKNRSPSITPEIETIIYSYLKFKAMNLGGIVHALNGIEDHVHMVVTIPPKISVAKFVGQVKGACSTRFNKEHKGFPSFAWQIEYAAFSFDKKRLPYIVKYVEHQKVHHRERSLIPILEKTEEMPSNLLGDEPITYLPDYASWHQDLAKELKLS
ncbi:MAG: IS200/IS605 family transposase [Chloroflexota bacterium]